MRSLLRSAAFLGLAGLCQAGVIIDKIPDLGAYWNPLKAAGGTYVYADSFVAPTSGDITTLGIYLLDQSGGGDPSQFRIQLWADNGGSPDGSNVLATTDILTDGGTSLHLSSAAVLVPVTVTAGVRYWVVGTTVGLSGTDEYKVGGHTQNSIYNDNGTFWYSNDPGGASFDGANLTPEMAIFASGDEAPEPATWTIGALGLGALLLRRRSASRA